MSVGRAEIGSRGAVGVFAAAGGIWTILALGVLAHVAWYLERGSLWLDEAFLALNIVHRSPVELLEKLDFGQGAPWGFLLGEKLAVATIGVGDRTLRLVPLLAALAALPLFGRVASFYLRGSGLVLAVLFFCFSPFLVLYSAEAKQYSVDVLGALVALWLAHSASQLPDWRRAAAVGLAGAALLWFSHPAMIVLGASGLAVGVAALTQLEGPAVRRLVIVGLLWAGSACAFFLFAWPRLAELHDFLAREDPYAFPFPPTSRVETELLAQRLSDILELPFGFFGRPWSALIFPTAGLLMLAGAASLARRDRFGAAILVAPVFATGVALASGFYPYAPRFVLFLVPLIIILVAVGTTNAVQVLSQPGRARRFVGAAAVAAAAFLLSMTGVSTARLLAGQQKMEEIRPILEQIRADWQPGDALYLYASSQYPARYYAEVDGVNRSNAGETLWPVVPTSGTSGGAPALLSAPPRLIVGRFRSDGGSTFDRDLAALHGREHVWFVFGHVVRSQGGAFVNDLDRYVAALDNAGQRRATIRRGTSLALLYDLRG
jgi:hypothetical protein